MKNSRSVTVDVSAVIHFLEVSQMKNSRHSRSVAADVLSQLLRTLIAFFVTVDVFL